MSGYIKATQSCETCEKGLLYNSNSLQCYVPVKPEDCIAPVYYIKATAWCEFCITTAKSGYDLIT